MERRFDLAVSAERGVGLPLADALLLITGRSFEDGGDVYLVELERILQAIFADIPSLGYLDPADLARLGERVAGIVHALACTAYFLPQATRQLQGIEPEEAVPLQSILLLVEQHLEALAARGDDPA